MNNRERAMNILHYRDADRLPAVHFGYWPELLVEWAEQGHLDMALAKGWRDGNDADREIDRLIGWDFNWGGAASPNNRLFPPFEYKVLEELPDGSRRIQNREGLIEKVKPGVQSIPMEDDYQLKDREAFEKLYKPRLTYTPERIDFDHYRHFNETRPQDRPVGLFLGSMMGDIRNYCSVIGMSYLIYDEDETLFEDIVNQNADMQFKVAEAVLSTGAAFDYGHFWEDICFKSGPLIDPKLFDKLTAPHYKKITDLCLAHGIDIVSLDCDGVTEQLLRTWIDNGVNTMFPIEVGVWGDQFEPARKKYGERMLGVGGMDKRAFREDKAAVDQEIERMKRLASLGGFIPCPDHRLMPGSKFELVQYYAEKIKDVRL